MKLKKVLALAAVTVLAVSPMAVYAADAATTEELAGIDGAVENDNSEEVSYYTVSLPTINADTYKFALDPDELLSEYNPDEYESGQTVYFNSTKTAGTIKVKNTKTLYAYSKEETTLSALEGNITGVTSTSDTDDDGNTTYTVDTVTFDPSNSLKYWVWTPDPSSASDASGSYDTGLGGKYVELTASNFLTYFDIETTSGTDVKASSVAVKSTYRLDSEGGVFDGKVYVDTYTSLSTAVPADQYGTVAWDDSSKKYTFTADTGVLFTKDDGTDATGAVLDTDYLFNQPVVNHNNKSDAVTIKNMSTFDTTVTATITFNGVDGLVFTDDTTFAADEQVTMSIVATDTDATNDDTVYVLKDAADTYTATYTAKLDKATNTSTTYQLNTFNVTGSHDYAQFESPNPTYASASFYITGETNKVSANEEAWDEYVAGLTAAPTIDVVYSIEKYVAEKAPSVAVTQVNHSAATGSTIACDLGAGDLAATGVTSYTWSSSQSGSYQSMPAGACSLSGNNIVLSTAAFSGAAIGDVRYLKITFNDTAKTSVIVKITKTA